MKKNSENFEHVWKNLEKVSNKFEINTHKLPMKKF